MGDHRASIKIEMEFHGIKDKCDMWINYYPESCCHMDKRVIDFFEEIYARGMKEYNKFTIDLELKEQEIQERRELERLKAKYEPLPAPKG